MIASLRGTLVDRQEDRMVIEAGGVGYEVFCAGETLLLLPPVGEEVFVHVQTDIREDAFNLYGFLRPEEKQMFCLLTGVSGVGPRLALAVLGHIRPADLVRLLAAGDASRLVKVPGIGKKTAERLCLELKDKVEALAFFPPQEPLSAAGAAAGRSPVEEDAVSALVNLGYPEAAARGAVERARQETGEEGWEDISLEELLRRALRSLA
ncbi:MAG TPA: Holliday junction branch migration protein RuvA [Desulfobacterales bacterium]|nr:Holliday junction branch migration protein RuvA [Desulfobacterales bacterium]